MLSLFFTALLATSATAIEYDLSGVDWSKVNYNDLPFFVLWGGGPVSSQRLDPVMTPGQNPSQHMHEFTGANLVSAAMTQDDLAQASCSTFQAKADKSAYWNPALYFEDPKTGAFTQVPGKAGNNRKLYYGYKTADGQLQPGISEFPKGFKMITGDPHATTQDAVQDCPNAECGYHQMAGKVSGWTCQGGDGVTRPGFPTGITDCPNGLRGQVMFPDCWNGQEFNPAAPHDHVAFSTGDGGVSGCPATHQAARFPSIYMEVNYDISSFVGQYTAADSPFVLAFGDKTGFGFHADFMNGWEAGSLSSVMSTCRQGDGSNPQTLNDQTCFGKVGGMYTSDEVAACSLPSAPGVGTKSASPKALPALPGCQTLTNTGATVDLKTCATTDSTGGDSVAARSVSETLVSEAVQVVRRTIRLAAGHGRFVEVDA